MKSISDSSIRATAEKFATNKKTALLAYDRILAALIKADYAMSERNETVLFNELELIQAKATTGKTGSNSLPSAVDRRYMTKAGRAAIRAEIGA
jgi:hypothetical protein